MGKNVYETDHLYYKVGENVESVRIHLLEAGSDFRRSSSSCAKCYLLPSPALHYNAALALLRPARLCNLCKCFKVVFPTSSMRVCRSSQSFCFFVLSQRKTNFQGCNQDIWLNTLIIQCLVCLSISILSTKTILNLLFTCRSI